ncbi:MAG: di-trans,poly-cis-decaprenylcistransferase [Gemmatimonadetes bacterium]|nr:polyprenyl diphosphate synthase [Gemmatimonadota bacterium]MYA12643.1 di-trans,poly-cis-decaprenylcistransferase [Gemmatimonadota bacterium]MYE69649.1 di-trans,poly-cis-decaprenylcistransferase [Gemmatimonadota bacterium]MYJ69456.1 di-trans,poly-cis-decaprenylcistransferase [Gemmatimonadota bacterium]
MAGHLPRHVAVIMDGNGRWAALRDLPRGVGHLEGMNAVREVVEGSCEAGVEILTLYAFSTENWLRPPEEIDALMGVLQTFAEKERERLARAGVEVRVLGEVERLDEPSLEAVRRIVETTRGGERLLLNLMISYGAREEIVGAARALAEAACAGLIDPGSIDEEAFRGALFTGGIPDPDLLIRTSGELRISNFMLWQLAYTEFHVTPVLWPDFTREDLFRAILDYQRRERRFGRVTAG